MTLTKDSQRIRAMFAGIAGRYDRLNHLLSLNIDALWRRRAVRELALGTGQRVLDLCTGTGDLAFALSDGDGARADDAGPLVFGTDFTPEMVRLGEVKRLARSAQNVRFAVADTLQLPFRDGTFDGATVAFGVRNLADLGAGLREILRVLAPGGRVAIIEFSLPRQPVLRGLYRLYFRSILPRLGGWLSRSPGGREAYGYLPASVEEFPGPERLCQLLEEAGFDEARGIPLTQGVAVLYLARRPARTGLAATLERSTP